MSDYLPLSGDTFPVRIDLAGLGGYWDKARKVWMIPALKIDLAKSLVVSMKRVKAEIQSRNQVGRRKQSKPLFSPSGR